MPLNLLISFLAVLVAALARWAIAGQAPIRGTWLVVGCMMTGGMLGAAVGSYGLARMSDERLHMAVRGLLVSIGVLLIAESLWMRSSSGIAVGLGATAAIAGAGGVGIGVIATLLGVAGGELIIPTLILLFGIPVKAAGTTSLLISIPTMIVGLTRYTAKGQLQGIRELRGVAVPMALGTVVGSALGGVLVAYAPAEGVKIFLGFVMIASALRVFKVRGET